MLEAISADLKFLVSSCADSTKKALNLFAIVTLSEVVAIPLFSVAYG